jgi:hypothetical protein
MGVIIGVVVGYVMGAKSGEQGLEEIRQAWATIKSSDEARDLVTGGLAMAASLISRGGDMLVQRLQADGNGSTSSLTALRPTG